MGTCVLRRRPCLGCRSHQCCPLMATGTLSKPLSKPSTLGTTPLTAMFQVLLPPPMEMLAVQPMEVLAVQSAAQRDSSLRMAETVQLQPPHE